jgi:hypothetical protein
VDEAIITIDWVNDEQVDIKVNDKVVTSVNHDNHGWDGMTAAIETATQIGMALGLAVVTEGTPNL